MCAPRPHTCIAAIALTMAIALCRPDCMRLVVHRCMCTYAAPRSAGRILAHVCGAGLVVSLIFV